MPKIFCLALGHRFRVVQEFGRESRRIKCERCGGDWGMNDGMRIIVDWCPDLQQIYRDFGYEILEPLPAWRSVAVEPLTWIEALRASRWPGVLAVALGCFIAYLGFGPLATFLTTFVTMQLVIPGAYQRARERKCNSLRA